MFIFTGRCAQSRHVPIWALRVHLKLLTKCFIKISYFVSKLATEKLAKTRKIYLK